MTTTGFAVADAADDFRRARRHAAWARAAGHLRPTRRRDLLVLDDVLARCSRAGTHSRGVQTIDLDTVVGTVGRVHDFDARFRPRRSVDGRRWERIDRLVRTEGLPEPVEVYRVGTRHFVVDGHHRVSVARALGLRTIEAVVTEVSTRCREVG